MKLAYGFLLIAGLPAADLYVCNSPRTKPGGAPCDYTRAQVQTAFNAASSGDTIYLEDGQVYPASLYFRGVHATPVVVTSMKSDWLPCPNCRITPSYESLTPTLAPAGNTEFALSGSLDGSNWPSGWIFRGVTFRTDDAYGANPGQIINTIVHTGGQGVGAGVVGYIANAANQPRNITFDRVFIRSEYADTVSYQNALRVNGHGITVKNTFIHPAFCSGVEGHGVLINTASNLLPHTLTNNFLSACSIPLFAGGSDPDYWDGARPDVVAKFNYLFRPLKWWNSASSPHYSYFLANGSKTVCSKNIGEFKALYRGLLEFNVHENIWNSSECQGQSFGFTNSVRQTTWASPGQGGSWGLSFYLNTITASGTSFSLTQGSSGWAAVATGHIICAVVVANNRLDCQRVATWDSGTHSGTVEAAFTGSYTGLNAFYWGTDPMAAVLDLDIQNSVFRNTWTSVSMLMRDMAVVGTNEDQGRTKRTAFRNNLFENTIPAIGSNGRALKVVTSEHEFYRQPLVGGGPIVMEHNTWKVPTGTLRGGLYLIADMGDANYISKIQGLTIRSNLWPQVLDDGGNYYALGVSGPNPSWNNWCGTESVAAAPLTVTHNYLPYASGASGCTFATVTANNSTPGAVAYLANTSKIAPGNVLSKAGHDGADIGANQGALPLIRNLKVTTSSAVALLEFDLSGPIADAGNTQPCVLEVSTSSNLESYLGSYAVINELNPAFFKQPDHSARSNPLLLPVITSGGHVAWPIGRSATVTGDDGVPHPLALAPDTQYFGRLQCYGDTAAFRFTTATAPSGETSRTMQFAPPSPTATVRLDYGPTAALGSYTSGALNGLGQATLVVPVTAGQHLFSQITYLGSSGNTLFRSPLKVELP